jgi:hypothetical protein
MTQWIRWLPEALIVVAAATMMALGPIPQPADYHRFADTRTLLGVPNGADVLSNAGFAVVGIGALLAIRGRRRGLASSGPGYRLFLGSVALTAFGSAWYHLAPDNARLMWDRLPIALACAGLLAAVHAETHAPRHPRGIAVGLALFAIASVLWWTITERHGAGDLRPYLLLQGAPLVLIPLWQAIHRSPRADRVAFGLAILCYVLAKVAELNDRAIFEALGFASGHTIKHLLATAAGAVLAANVVRRARTAE